MQGAGGLSGQAGARGYKVGAYNKACDRDHDGSPLRHRQWAVTFRATSLAVGLVGESGGGWASKGQVWAHHFGCSCTCLHMPFTTTGAISWSVSGGLGGIKRLVG